MAVICGSSDQLFACIRINIQMQRCRMAVWKSKLRLKLQQQSAGLAQRTSKKFLAQTRMQSIVDAAICIQSASRSFLARRYFMMRCHAAARHMQAVALNALSYIWCLVSDATALCLAACHGHLQVTSLQNQSGTNPSLFSYYGTPLSRAVREATQNIQVAPPPAEWSWPLINFKL